MKIVLRRPVKVTLTHALAALVAAAATWGAVELNKHPGLQNFVDREAIAIRALGFACGIERWPIKTLADPAAARVNFTPRPTTIAALVALPSTGEGARQPGAEETTWRLQTTVIAFKQEADSDIHLELSDGAGRTMIAEIPLQSCVTTASSPVVAAQQLRIGIARAAFERTLAASGVQVTGAYQTVSIPAVIDGVGFFDFLHGQQGVAPNGVELHPVLSFVAGTTPPPPGPPPPPPIPPSGDDVADEAPGCVTYPGRIWLNHVRQSHCSATFYLSP